MRLTSNTNEPTFAMDDLSLHWQMTRAEKFAFKALVEKAKPETAIEIGTYQGGTLQIIAEQAKKVYSLDISSEPRDSLQARFNNVEFRVGDSKGLIAEVLQNIDETGEELGFVLIDGDHSTNGVRGDLNAVLKYKPKRDIYIIFHDSFNPDCRKGILEADWQNCPYIHFVEMDFVQGVMHIDGFDTAQSGSMWGGLAVAVMKPQKRDFELVIHQSQKGLFDTVYPHSCHVPSHSQRPPTFTEKVIWRLKKMCA